MLPLKGLRPYPPDGGRIVATHGPTVA
jgi:hypothetical protein